MQHRARIKSATERSIRAVGLRPTVGQETIVSRTRLVDGLRCEIDEGPWKLTVDLPEGAGGESAGPSPGVLGRGAFGACLAMSYAIWAATLDFPVDGIEVEVQVDTDARGELGIGNVPAGYSNVRYTVTLETDASDAEIVRFLDEAEAKSTYLHVWGKPHEMAREIVVLEPRSAR